MRTSIFLYVKPHKIILDTSEELWLLLDKKKQEELLLTMQYAVNRRNEVQSGTIENEMRALAYLYEHAFRQNFDLDSYLTLKKGFNADSFYDFIRSLFVYLQTGESNPAIAGAISSRISLDSFSIYWTTIQQYVRYWLERSLVFKASDRDEKEIISLYRQILYLEDRLKQFISKAPRKLNVKVLREKQLAKLIEVFHPTSVAFKSESVKWRNWVIFLLTLDTGIRRGELLNLYVSDFPRGSNANLSIERRPDNPKDPRKQRPRVKTNSRRIAISQKTKDAVNHYIINYRSDYAGVPHLFLNDENSNPLSISTLESVFTRVSSKLGFKVTPHMVRHTRHYKRLLDLSPKLGFEKSQDIVCIEGGWSPKSGIPETYIHQYNLDLSNQTAPFFLESLVK